ncbi:hypothetical protein ACHQM5_028319 [Ranunculus cassubicifolius]
MTCLSRKETMVPLLLFFLFLPLVLGAPEASPSLPPSPSNITIGSYITASRNNGTNYWLSPSGNFAFGFHPSGNKIGIWIDKSPAQTLVWTADIDEQGHPINDSSLIELDNDGVFVLRRLGVIPKPLFDIEWQPASYASMNDNGNFIIYNATSDILWQSFDYPTDTLLPGQTMTVDKHLVSSSYCLEFRGEEDLAIVYDYPYPIWTTGGYKKMKGKPVALNLDSTGGLNLVNKDGLITTNLTEGEERVGGETIYRATMGSDGVLRVYGERFDGEIIELWRSYCSVCLEDLQTEFWMFLWFGLVCLVFGTLPLLCGIQDGDCFSNFLITTITLMGVGFNISALVVHFHYIRHFHY